MKSHTLKMMRYRDSEGISDLGNRPRGNGSAIQSNDFQRGGQRVNRHLETGSHGNVHKISCSPRIH